jgi:uncharacterized protein
MSTHVPITGPIESESRIQALDIARGVALFGILLMNITAFGLPHAYSDPTVAGGAEGADRWAWIITTLLFEGTQRGLFTLLFGAGVILLTASLEASGRPNATDLYFRRNLWLVVFGVIHGFLLLWTGEILYFYGITALFVYGLRHAKTKTLLSLAIGGVLFAAAWSGLDTWNGLEKHREFVAADSLKTAGDSLTTEQSGAIEAWEGMVKEWKPDSAKIQKEIDAKQGSYWDILKFQAPGLTHWQSWGMYRYFFDFFSMMLFGMVLFRAGFFRGRAPPRALWTMILVGYGIGLTVNYFEVSHVLAENFSVLSFLRTNITYDVGRIPLTMGHLGLLLLFAQSPGFAWLKSGLAAVGRMAFTNYIMTSIICAFVFYGFGFGLYGELQRHQLYYVVGGVWLFQLVASPLWLRRFRFGPLEWLWRWLTYGEKPAMRGAASGVG